MLSSQLWAAQLEAARTHGRCNGRPTNQVTSRKRAVRSPRKLASIQLERLEPRIVLTGDIGNTIYDAAQVSLSPGMPTLISTSIGDQAEPYFYGMATTDDDMFALQLSQGQAIYADLDAQETSSGTPISSLDGYLRLFDSSGYELLNNDDALGADPFLTYTATVSGTYYLGVSGAPNRTYSPMSSMNFGTASTGDYQLKLTVGGSGSSSGGSSSSGSSSSGSSSSGSSSSGSSSSGSSSSGSSSSGSSSSSSSSSGSSSSGSSTTGGSSQNTDGSYTLHPGETLSIPQTCPITNNSPDSDGPTGPGGDVYVWPDLFYDIVKPVPGAGGIFNLTVWGSLDWQSDKNISMLTVRAYGGNIGVAPIDGSLFLNADGGIGDLDAGYIEAQAGTHISNVKCSGDVSLEGAGAIGDVDVQSASIMVALQYGDNVHVKGDAHWVQGRFPKDLDVDGNLIHLDCLGAKTINVGGNAGDFRIMGPVTELDVGGSIHNLNFSGDMTPTVTIGGSIGLVNYDQSSYSWVATDWPYDGLTVGGSIASGSTLTAMGTNLISVTGDIAGTITLGGSLKAMAVNGKIDNATITVTGNIGSVVGNSSIQGTIESKQGTFGYVVASTSIQGTIKSLHDLGSVRAGTTLDATITSTTGSIGSVMAEEDLDGSISARTTISTVSSNEDISATISATAESIGTVEAPGNISGSINAGTSIQRVRSTNGSITGSITAGGSIDTIQAKLAIGGGSSVGLQAGGSITTILAETGDIDADIDSLGSITSISAPTGDFDGSITAAVNVGDVWIGGEIQSDVIATSGNIDSVVAGMDHSGNITGTIQAGRSIGAVMASATLSTPSSWNNSSSGSINPPTFDTTTLLNMMIAGTPLNTLLTTPEVPTSTAGNINGSILAGRSIGQIFADGSINDTITAGLSLPTVFAIGDIAGSISTGMGGICVEALGSLSSTISAVGSVAAEATGSVTGDISSTTGCVSASAWGELRATITALSAVTLWSKSFVGGHVTSQQSGIQLVSLGDAEAQLQSYASDVVQVAGRFMGSVISRTLSAYLGAGSLGAGINLSVGLDVNLFSFSTISVDVGVGAPTLPFNTTITTWGDYTGQVESRANVNIVAQHDVTSSSVKSQYGNISVTAQKVTGSYRTLGDVDEIGEPSGNVAITAYATFDATVNAKRSAAIYSGGDLKGSINADEQFTVSAIGNLEANLASRGNADGDNTATTWGNLNGDVSTASSVKLFAYGDVAGDITTWIPSTGTPSLDVDLQSYGTVSGDINSAGDAKVMAAKGITGKVTAMDDINVISWNGITGKLTAGNPNASAVAPSNSPTDGDEHVLVVSSRGIVSGDLVGQNGVVVDAFGNISSKITAPSGTVQATARVYLAPDAAPDADGTDSDISGKITAARGITLNASGSVSSQDIVGSTVTISAGHDISAQTVTGTTGPIGLSTFGGVSSNTITGTAITIGASGDVDCTSITATTGAVSIQSDGAIDVSSGGGNNGSQTPAPGTSSGISATGTNGAITLTAGDTVIVDVSSTGAIVISSGDAVQAKGVSTAGAITVTGAGNISNSTLTTPLKLTATSYGGVQNSTLTSTGAAVEVFGMNALTNVTVAGNSGVDASTLIDIQNGSYKSATGKVELYAGGAIRQVTVESQTDANVEASTSISGTIKSRADNINVESTHGDITATMTANDDATVVTLEGDIAGTITTILGNIEADAAGSIIKSLTAQSGSIDANALENITSPSILAAGKITVTALGTAAGDNITSFNGDVIASIGEDVLAAITAGNNATVTSWLGSITKSIYAPNGDVNAWAGVNVEKSINAGHDANVYAQDDVNDTVTAGNDTNVTAATGSVKKEIQAGRDANVFAFVSVIGPVTSTRDADVESLGSVVGEINAGRDVTGFSGDFWQSPVIGGRNVWIYAVGDFNTHVTAGGNISIGTEGTFQGGAASGINLSVYTFAGASGTLNAGDNLTLTSLGTSSAILTAVGDADVMVADLMTGSVDAGGNVEISGFDIVSALVHAGGDASVFAGKDIDHSVTAGGAAYVEALGSISGINVTAGATASLFAVGSVTTCNVTGADASLISWDFVGGPSMVTGTNSAFGFAYDDFVGSVASSAGSASLICMGNVTGGVTAATDAGVLTVNRFAGGISAGDSIAVITLGGFTGTATAGLDAVVLSEADFAGTVNAGRDGFVLAYQTVSGLVSTGRDLEAGTFGALSATLSAGRDVLGASAGGDLSSTIIAGRNVGDILTYGAFSGAIVALNPSADPQGGKIGNVISQGPMSGAMTAAAQIGYLLSGDAITTSTTAPSVGTPVEFDTAYFTNNPAPTLPASDAADVLADALDSKNDVLANKVTFQTDLSTFLNGAAVNHAATLTSVVTSRTDQLASVSQDRADNQQTIDTIRSGTASDFYTSRIESDTQRTTRIDEAINDEGDFSAQFAGSPGTNATAHAQGVSEARQENARIKTELDRAASDKSWAGGAAANLRSEQGDWYNLVQVAIGQGINNGIDDFVKFWQNPIGNSQAMIDSYAKQSVDNWDNRSKQFLDGHQQIVNAVDTDGSIGFTDIVQIVGWHAATATGIRSLYTGFTGQDPITGQRYRSSERFYQVVGGAIQLAETIVGAASIYSRLTSPCKSWWFGKCFVGDTLVVVAKETPPGTTIVDASFANSDTESSDGFETALIFVTAGVAGFVLIERRKHRNQLKYQRKQKHQRHQRLTTLPRDAREPNREAPTSNAGGGNSEVADLSSEVESRSLSRASHDNEIYLFSMGNPAQAILDRDLLNESEITLIQYRNSGEMNQIDFCSNVTVSTRACATSQEWTETSWEDSDTVAPVTRQRSATQFSASIAWLVASVLLAFSTLLPPFSWREVTSNQATAAIPSKESSAPKLKYREIQNIRTGMRVIAENPELVGQNIAQFKINPETWRNATFRMDKPDGGDLLVTLLRSLDWLREQKVEVGKSIRLHFSELGIDGPATVLSIEACPPIENGLGRLVTGTFCHSAADVIDLYISTEPKPIGTTSNHPFWSETHREFVKATNLLANEQLRGTTGQIPFVNAIVPRSSHHSVYNLEIEGQHCYAVGQTGVVVHNAQNYADDAASKGLDTNRVRGKAREADELVDLRAKHPTAAVQRERYLRTADGKRAIDPLTGEGRRIDFAVIDENQTVVELVETTSQTASKVAQAAKEGRIREAGGTYIRNAVTKVLINVSNVLTRLSRRD